MGIDRKHCVESIMWLKSLDIINLDQYSDLMTRIDKNREAIDYEGDPANRPPLVMKRALTEKEKLKREIEIDNAMKKHEETEKAISDIISGMAFFLGKEDEKKSADDTRKVLDFYINECNRDDDYYATQMHLICHRFNEVPAKPWLMSSYRQHVQRWDKFIIESIFNGLFSHWVYKMIEHHEDNSGGQTDKERFITRRLIEAIDTQTNISLYCEYKDEPGKQAYWSPKYFKDTHQVKVEFVSWWMGKNMEKYVS